MRVSCQRKHISPPTANNESPHPALGIDYGASRIGIAATDEFGIMAHPVETIHSGGKGCITRICEIATSRKTRSLVVGLPLRLDGTEGDSAKNVRKFAAELRKALPALSLIYVDESYTTATAAGKLREAGKKAKDHKKIIDQAAAVEILNLWMEEIS